MKTIEKLLIAIIGISPFMFFSGCGIYDKIDLEKVKQEISLLKTTSFDLLNVKETLDQQTLLFGNLETIEVDELEDFKIEKNNIEKENGKFLIAFAQEKPSGVNITPFTFYIIVKPAEDKKELLASQIDHYYQNLFDEYSLKEDATGEKKEHLKNIMKKEYEGYLIYILSNNNEKVWNLIEQNSHPLLFLNTKELSLDEFSEEFLVDKKNIKEFQAFTPSVKTSASLYLIVRPSNGKADVVKKELDSAMNLLEARWSTYLPEEYQLVKNRIETEIGSYLIYVISKDNTIVLDTIKNTVVKKKR